MGNTGISLPMNIVNSAVDRTNGIPTGPTQQESRSVLENVISPHFLIPVAPASGDVPAQRPARPPVSATPTQPQTSTVYACTSTVNIDTRAGPMASNKVLSWADVVNRKR